MLLTLLILAVYRACVTTDLVNMTSLATSLPVAKWLERPTGERQVIGAIPVGVSAFFFVPRSWQTEYSIISVEDSVFFCLTLIKKKTVSWQWFALQCISTWMRGNFGNFCRFCPELPRVHVQRHCNANDKCSLWKGLYYPISFNRMAKHF